MEALLEVADYVATITLNRPEKLNAWTAQMARETREAMLAADANPEVRMILLTGAGRGFCAGADMSLLNTIVAGGLDDKTSLASRRAPIPEVSKPVIAAVNGPAVGLGLALALFCDLRMASESARFGTAFARRGLIAEFGLAWILPRLAGLGNALDMLLTGRLVDAAEARQIGLVSRVLPDEGFAEAAGAWVKELAAVVSPRSTRIIKRQVYEALSQDLDTAFETAEREMHASLRCEDFKEGVAHFMEKRPPSFTGK
jgi:enoyl-CoA hydratase/carnithine racemase